ncbi:TetR family transcriptional regulator [Salmonella enterica subsp. enterica serovar Choleraesuis]|nr:TetR family transcriptional regulator [Salmonella enterica subsp. enterica serovar Choleraesuis]
MSSLSVQPSASKVKGRPRSFDREQALVKALNLFWVRGYELTSVAELCSALEIKPPSLYAAFGNKAQLFLEAVSYYEEKYWDGARRQLELEPDVHQAIAGFFKTSLDILLSPAAPCGCLVVIAAAGVSPEDSEVSAPLKALRRQSHEVLMRRLQRGIDEGQLPASTNPATLATVFTTLLEGISVQLKDGAEPHELYAVGEYVMCLMPARVA